MQKQLVFQFTGAPFLRRVTNLPERFDRSRYPFNIPVFSQEIDVAFDSNLSGRENGSGKSTLL